MTLPNRALRVCYFGTYRRQYPRNRLLISGLRENQVEVVECHAPLWRGFEDREQTVRRGWLKPAFWMRLFKAYRALLRQHARLKDYDVLVVGYPGLLDVFLARVLSAMRSKPLVWDVFMSVYLIACERQLHAHFPLSVRFLQWLEWLALRLPNLLVLDTAVYAAWFEKQTGIPAGKFHLVPACADQNIFQPAAAPPNREGFRVLYFGTFIPNHGVEYIVRAAAQLNHHAGIRFDLIGEGPQKSAAQALAQKNELTNLTFHPWMSKPQLNRQIARADLVLGAFGDTPQSKFTVQNKILQGMAAGKAVLSGDSPTMRQTFQHGEQIYLCARADGHSLAEAIWQLAQNPALRLKIAQNGRQLFQQRFTSTHTGRVFRQHLLSLLEES